MINIGVIGLGRGFMLTRPALEASSRTRLCAAFDVRPLARLLFADTYDATAHGSLDALFADASIDAVYIASPHEFHAEHAIAAARAGKHVLVEKPMATSVEEARRMVAAAEAAGTVLVVGPSHGFDEPIARASELLREGRWGAVRMINAMNYTDFMYRPRRKEEMDVSRGGGVVYTQGAHHFDVVRQLAGRPVLEVTAATGDWDSQRHGAGAYMALVRFDGGAFASMTYSGYAHYDSDELMGWISELGVRKDEASYGAARRRLAELPKGGEAEAKIARTFGGQALSPAAPSETANEHFGFVMVSCEHADLKICPDGIWVFGDSERSFLPVGAPLVPRQAVIDEFASAITGEGASGHDGAWGLDTMLCCAALARSAELGRTVAISELT